MVTEYYTLYPNEFPPTPTMRSHCDNTSAITHFVDEDTHGIVDEDIDGIVDEDIHEILTCPQCFQMDGRIQATITSWFYYRVYNRDRHYLPPSRIV